MTSFVPLPAQRLTLLQGWAMRARSMGYVYRPSTMDGVCEVLQTARSSGRSLVPRGSGFSYGDTALNAENIVLDLSRMNRILEWDPAAGTARVEPGVTIGQLWRHTLEDGWWPAVVPGTMFPTLGGCAATNVHGKNNYRVGTIGEHIVAFELLLPDGRLLTCSPTENADIYHAAIGGLGMLGIFVSLTLQLQRVASGLVRVEEYAAHDLAEMFALFESNTDRADYLLGWIDAFATGAKLGRGLVHVAHAVHDDPHPTQTLRVDCQDVPDTLFGVVPRSALWRGMKLGAHPLGMRALNTARYTLGAQRSGRTFLTPHAQYHFILDYVPNWKWAYRPGGLVQYQVFVPREQASAVFAALLEGSQTAGLVPHLAVFKRHRTDPFLLSYGVDGYSLALDYHATSGSAARIGELLARFTDEVVLPAGGRFYPAKDTLLNRAQCEQSFSAESVGRFLAMKRRLDPDELFQSDLYRRAFVA